MATKAKAALQNKLPEYGRMFFSLKHGFSAEWGQLNEDNNVMNFELKTEHLPFFLRGETTINVKNAALVLVSKRADLTGKQLILNKGIALNFNLSLAVDADQNPVSPCSDLYLYNANASGKIPVKGEWTAAFDGILDEEITIDNIEDVIIGFNLQQ